MTERELLPGTGGTVNISAQGVVGHAGKFLQLADAERMVAHATLGGSDGVQAFDACHGITFDGRTQTGTRPGKTIRHFCRVVKARYNKYVVSAICIIG